MSDINQKKTHELKILPHHFKDILLNDKRCEIRKNDRDFKVGDTLILQEWDQDYSGKEIEAEVMHIETYMQKENYVVISINIKKVKIV